MQQYIGDDGLPEYTAESVRHSPIVRVEYEQAIAIGGIGETLYATRSKHWGDGPRVAPLEEEDWFDSQRITYVYRENSLYNRRFEQRMRMKDLLGRRFRRLVGQAKYRTKKVFLSTMTAEEADVIRRIFGVEPGVFWRACKGKHFLDLPPRLVQLELDFGDVETAD